MGMIEFEDRDEAGQRDFLAYLERRPLPKRKPDWLAWAVVLVSAGLMVWAWWPK
jgi:hypothetical protein